MRLKDYEILYDLPSGEYDGRGIDGIRTVTVRAGRSLEVMCHPIIRISQDAKREIRERKTTAAMARINARNRERHHMRLIEANFTEAAQVITLTYAYPVEDYGMCSLKELSDEYDKLRLPWEVERVQKDLRNFRARLRRWVIRHSGSDAGFKWDITIEEGKEPPATGLPPKYHAHAVIEGPGITREVIEAMWPHGWVRCEKLDLSSDGAMRLARYLNKQRHPGRWWSHSRNLKIPQPRVSDRKLSRRRMAAIAADVQLNGREILERLYPGYKVVELPDVKYSDFVSGCYIYARMRRRD